MRRQRDGRDGPEVLSAGPAVRSGSAVLRTGRGGRRRVPAADGAGTAERIPGGGRCGDVGLRVLPATVRQRVRVSRRDRRGDARADKAGPVGLWVVAGLLLRPDVI